MFLDEVEVEVKGGRGGNGIASFRREKFVPRGGPNGGHGGHGGDVVLVADEGLNTLHPFRFKKHYEAKDGGRGGSNNKRGADGDDLRLEVPVGTVVRDAETDVVLADLTQHGQEAVVATGGRGGRGNSAFKSPTNQAPRLAEKGEPGQRRRIVLELKLIADVGLVGLPNAGKSTLLSVLTAAKPKIADYPFTTLTPSLGVAEVDHETIVFADIPGLIEGAHEGTGLGDQFLRHIERTRLLVHLLDGAREDPLDAFHTINRELAAFNSALADRPQIVVLNKIDLPDARERWPELRDELEALGYEDVMAISAATTDGIDVLLRRVRDRLAEMPESEPEPETLPVLRPIEEDEDAFTVYRIRGVGWRVAGTRVERAAAVTDWSSHDAVLRFQRILDAIGVTERLRALGVQEGDTVRIGDRELEWSE